MEQSLPWQLVELLQVSHSYHLTHHLGFSAFPKISDFVTKQVLYYITYKLYKLQSVNIGLYIYIHTHKIQKLWAVALNILNTKTSLFLKIFALYYRFGFWEMNIINVFSWLRISVKITSSIAISQLTILLNKSINRLGQLNWVWLSKFLLPLSYVSSECNVFLPPLLSFCCRTQFSSSNDFTTENNTALTIGFY